MGMPVFGGSRKSHCVPATSAGASPTGDPNPRRFEVLREKRVGDVTVAMIRYPDCINHKGVKVLVYAAPVFDAVKASGAIDPHFGDPTTSPFARFQPTETGWEWALAFAGMATKSRWELV